MNARTPENKFQTLWDLGFKTLIPVIPPGAEISERSTLYKRLKSGKDDRGKVPGRSFGDGLWSSFDWISHEATEADLVAWHFMGASVGVKTGIQPDGTHLNIVDIDTLNAVLAKICTDAAGHHLGANLPVRIGNAPKTALLLRTREPFDYRRVEFGTERVEILSAGRQFVAWGIHPKTGKPYSWPTGLPKFDDIPIVEPVQIMDFLGELTKLLPEATPVKTEGGGEPVTNQATLRADPEIVAKAVAAIPNTAALFPTREAWVDMGYKIRAAMGPEHVAEGLELFQSWSSDWVDEFGNRNDPDYVEQEWRRMKGPYRTGAPALLAMAAEMSGGSFDPAIQYFDQTIADEVTEASPDSFSIPFDGEAQETLERNRARFRFTTFDEAVAQSREEKSTPLIKGLIDQGAMSVLYGASNTGKTFLAMDINAHVASGMAWGGMKTAQGPTVYAAMEGGRGAKRRADALRRKFPDADLSQFHFLLTAVDLLKADVDLKLLIEAIKGLPVAPVLLTVDTLARAMSGGDENSFIDMSAFVRNIGRLQEAIGCHVMIVHHTGKDQARGARGHSSLRAATDTEIEIADGTLTVTKQRDLDKSFTTAFGLDVVGLGLDADGEPVTSCVVRLMGREEAKIAQFSAAPGVPTIGEAQVLDAVEALDEAADEPGKGFQIGAIVSALFARDAVMSAETARKHAQSLVVKRLLTKTGRGQYGIKKAEDPNLPVVGQAVENKGSSGFSKSAAIFD